MKNSLLLFSIVIFFSINCFSQVKKGSWFIEVDTPLTGEGIDKSPGISAYFDDEEYLFSVGGEGGYVIIDNLAILGGLGYLSGDGGFNYFQYSLGPKYFIIGKIPITTTINGGTNFKSNSTNFIYSGSGYLFQLKDWIAIEVEVGVNYGLDIPKPYGVINTGISFFIK